MVTPSQDTLLSLTFIERKKFSTCLGPWLDLKMKLTKISREEAYRFMYYQFYMAWESSHGNEVLKKWLKFS